MAYESLKRVEVQWRFWGVPNFLLKNENMECRMNLWGVRQGQFAGYCYNSFNNLVRPKESTGQLLMGSPKRMLCLYIGLQCQINPIAIFQFLWEFHGGEKYWPQTILKSSSPTMDVSGR
jgi:hypothetical protein